MTQAGRRPRQVRRRLAPEVRRAEIVEVATHAIVEIGFSSLSMREIARRCGMSTPGMMHYFADLSAVLDAVLENRDQTDFAAILSRLPDDAAIADVLGEARTYYTQRPREVQAFDVLEAESLDPGHPAHLHFAQRAARVVDRLRPIVEREFADPDAALRIVRIVLDGIRVERLRTAASPAGGETTAGNDAADWAAAARIIELLPRRA